MRPSVALRFAPPSDGEPPWQQAWAHAVEGRLLEGARLAGAHPPADAKAGAGAEAGRAGQAVALYERALALPAGPERRELARAALAELYRGDARVFVALATRMALGPGRGLGGVGVRARLSLAFALPPARGLPTSDLALALLRRPELARRFAFEAVEGSLPERCLAARLLERAAFAAAARPAGQLAEAFGPPALAALARLLDDPDPFIWTHAASARGLLAPALAPLGDELARGLDFAAAGARVWARALVSLVASLASGPAGAMLALKHAVGRGPFLEPATLAGAVSALALVAEAKPEVAAEALGRLLPAAAGRPDGALGAAVARLGEPLRAVARARGVEPRAEGAAERALGAYLNEGAGAAHAVALEAASLALEALEARPAPEFARLRAGVSPLVDDGTLWSLLALAPKEAGPGPAALEGAYDRLVDLALAGDEPPPAAGVAARLARRWQLRALAHVADAPAPCAPADHALAERSRRRRARVAKAALGRVASAGPAARAWATIFARAAGRLAGEGAWDELDVALLAADAGLGEREVAMVSEASARAGVRALLAAWREGPRRAGGGPAGRLAAELGRRPLPRARAAGAALDAFARAVAALAAAPSLEACAESGGADRGALAALAAAAAELERPLAEARRRAGIDPRPLRPSRPLLGLHALLERALRTGDRAELDLASAAAADALAAALPGPLGAPAAAALGRIARLPAYARPGAAPAARAGGTLPPWMPPNRTVGGFYLERALGRGSSGTVFLARRSDDRHDPRAPRFALKVPSGGRSSPPRAALVEQMMRDEAVALLGLPDHPNLARLVTVDLSTRPGPIVVTELVEGVSAEQIIAARRFDAAGAVLALDGLLEGLAAMHEIGVGHLDVKPSNVLVRADGSAVLVDFGLAGRALRPGYISGPYASPEAWGAAVGGGGGGPPAADVYAFACFAFEAMTGRALFEADTNVALLAAHLTHDGWPPRLAALARCEGLGPFASLLARALRREPGARASAREVSAELARLAPALAALPWPVAPPEALA